MKKIHSKISNPALKTATEKAKSQFTTVKKFIRNGTDKSVVGCFPITEHVK